MTNFNPEKTISATTYGMIVNAIKFSNENSYVKNIQLHGTTKYQQTNNVTFNPKQENLYLKALHGLDAYSKKEKQKLDEIGFNKVKTTYNRESLSVYCHSG